MTPDELTARATSDVPGPPGIGPGNAAHASLVQRHTSGDDPNAARTGSPSVPIARAGAPALSPQPSDSQPPPCSDRSTCRFPAVSRSLPGEAIARTIRPWGSTANAVPRAPDPVLIS